MSAAVPRLRMFAGPNGSGKSTLKSYLPASLLGVYLNPDEIENEICERGFLDFSMYGLNPSAAEVISFFAESTLLKEAKLSGAVKEYRFAGGRLEFGKGEVNSYVASVAGDLLRQKLLEQGTSFTFETVMSHPSKIEI